MEKTKIIVIGITGNIISDQRMLRIADTLSKNNFEVHLFFRPYFKYKTQKEIPLNYSFKCFQVKTTFNQGVLFYLNYNFLLFFKLLFKKTDLLYAVDTDTLPAFSLLSILKRKPLIFDSHEYFCEVPELLNQPFKKKIWHWMTVLGVRLASINLSVSETLSSELSKIYKKEFQTIRNVPVLNPQSLLPYEKKTIIYQGALNQGRELELLIITMSELKNFDCLIIGEGDLSESLRQLAIELKAENVKFLGLLSPDELKKITGKCFAAYNLLVSESKSYYLSLSNKYFDYMHAGVPSISSYLPEYELLNKTNQCGVCIENEKSSLKNILLEWSENKEHYEQLKQNALFAAQNYNWGIESKKLLKILEL